MTSARVAARRVAIKRRLRAAGVPVANDASTADLVRLTTLAERGGALSIQPSKGSDLWTVEARDADGALRFDCEQPPREFLRVSLDDLYNAMFRALPDAVGTWDELRAWLASKSWTPRRVTW